jgi:hypothetical protein
MSPSPAHAASPNTRREDATPSVGAHRGLFLEDDGAGIFGTAALQLR